MVYNFLILSLLFMIPGIIIYAVRKDLRSVIHVMALCSIPFAFTERFFYPSYWEPVFLFNLIDIIGFGIEDILFVIGLAAFTSTSYAFFTKQFYQSIQKLNAKQLVYRCLMVLVPAFLLVGLMVLTGIKMIFGSLFIMVFISSIMTIFRKDLLRAGLLGGFFSTIIYTVLCLCIALFFPGIFQLTWHTDQFLNLFILGIPVEEIFYAYTSGMIATVFYPFVFHLTFYRKASEKL